MDLGDLLYIFYIIGIDFYRYYYNKVTKQSKWQVPEELKVAELISFFVFYFKKSLSFSLSGHMFVCLPGGS